MLQTKRVTRNDFLRIILAITCALLVTIWVFDQVTRNFTVFIQNMSLSLVYGLTFSMLLFLMTSGFFLIFGLADVINFAHGAFFMLGGFIGYESYLIVESILLTIPLFSNNYFLLSFISFMAALIGAAIILGVIGAGIEFFTIRRLYGNAIGQILLTVGFLYIIQQICEIFWGPQLNTYNYITGSRVSFFWLPRTATLEFVGIQFEIFRVFLIFFGLLIALGMFLILTKTKIGIIIQAGIEDTEMVQALGIDTKLMFTLVFIAGAALSGLAGAVAIPLVNANVTVAGNFLIYAFVIVVIGGAHYGKLEGTFFASLIVGLSVIMCQFFFPGFEGVIIFFILILILVFRPGGLTGEPM
jgi:branched-chain amino acid transport system permease protein